MSQRLSGVSDQDAEGVAKDVIEGSNVLLGRTSNLVRILAAHSPYLARWFLGLVAAVRQPSVGAVSDVRLRNLATIKTSVANECTYCATHTSIYGQALGLAQPQLDALQGNAYRSSPLFDEREKAAVAWAEAVTLNTAKSDKALWETMRRLFTDAEIVEITMASAMFNMINRLNDTFWYLVSRLIQVVALDLFKLKVSGLEKLPKSGPCIISSNHESYLDPAPLAGVLPAEMFYRAFAVGTSEIFGEGLMRRLARSSADWRQCERAWPGWSSKAAPRPTRCSRASSRWTT